MFKQAVNISEVMSLRRPGITNFYPEEERLKFWIEKGFISCLKGKEANLIFRKDHDFYRLYYYAAGTESLHESLSKIDEPCVIDLVGVLTTVSEIASAVEYKRYTSFKMLQNTKPSCVARYLCTTNHIYAKDISRMLEQSFDRYAEQLPEEDEIKWFLRQGEVFLTSRNFKATGVIIGNRRGLIRYYLVSKESRGEGVGSELIRSYLSGKGSSKVFVISTNHKAIDVYEHFGFAETAIINVVLTNLDIKYEAKDN